LNSSTITEDTIAELDRSVSLTTLKKMGESHSESLAPFDIVVLVLFGIIGLLGSIGNLVILLSVYVNRNLRRITHVLIMNLALSDFLLCALSIPLRVLRICVRKSIFESEVLSSDAYCRVTSGINAAILGTSSYGIFLLTVDKFLAVTRPMLYRTGNHTKHMIAPILASWLIPLSMGLCGAFIPALQANLNDHSHDVACIHSSTFGEAFALSSYFSMLLIPLILIFPMYFYIIFKVRKSGSVLSQSETVGANAGQAGPANNRKSAHEINQRRREMRLTKGIILILGTHLVCLTPIIVLDFIHIILGEPIPHMVDEIFLLILYLNAVLDPPIYTRHSRELKSAIMRLFCQFQRSTGARQADSTWKRGSRPALRVEQQMINMNSSSLTAYDNRVQDSTFTE